MGSSKLVRGVGVLAFCALATLFACGGSPAEPPPAGPIGVHPMLSSGVEPHAKHCASAPHVAYNGGPVLQNAKVYSVYWGSNISTTVTDQMPLFYADVVASPYFDWLSEYDTIGLTPGTNQGISRGSFAGSVTIAPSLCAGTGSPGSCALTDAQVRAELVAQIAAGHLPAPTKGCDGQPDTVYMVSFDSSVQITTNNGLVSCVTYCAYHGTSSYLGTGFAYAVLPDLSTGPCAGAGCGLATNTVLQNTTAVASHELAEATTDGLAPLAWTDPVCGEIADICLLLYGTIDPSGTTWTVTQLWSNAVNDCITTKLLVPPVCTGPDVPAGCRPCACSDDGQGAPGEPGCAGAAPVCDTTAGYCTGPDAGAADGGGAASEGGTAGDGATPAPPDAGPLPADAAAPDVGAVEDASVLGRDAALDASGVNAEGDDTTAPGKPAGCSCRVAGANDPARSGASLLALVAVVLVCARRRHLRGT